MIRKLASSLTQFQNQSFDGCLLVKASFRRLRHNVEPELLESRLLKSNRRLVTLESKAYFNQEVIGCLQITLMLHPATLADINESLLKQESGGYFQAIQPQKVYEFSNLTGDKNSIHLTVRPIVQGLLLLELIDEEYLKPNEIAMRFLAPVYAGQPMNIKKQELNLWGYSQHRLCFQAQIT